MQSSYFSASWLAACCRGGELPSVSRCYGEDELYLECCPSLRSKVIHVALVMAAKLRSAFSVYKELHAEEVYLEDPYDSSLSFFSPSAILTLKQQERAEDSVARAGVANGVGVASKKRKSLHHDSKLRKTARLDSSSVRCSSHVLSPLELNL